jgi:aryl carrier-like protein
MGLLNLIEEVAGAVVAEEAVKKLDPDANLLTEGLAAFAGFKGVEKIKEHFEQSDSKPPDPNLI